ncbi:hypothetical protein BSNK01_05300 [Bacillaceae bacterium]
MQKKRWFLGAALLAVSVLFSGCGGAKEEGQPEQGQQQQEQANQPPGAETAPAGDVDAAAAEKVYQQNCMSCHGQNLEGGAGPKLSDVGARMSKEEILQIIQNGKPPRMPGGLVSGQEAENLAAWLATKK